MKARPKFKIGQVVVIKSTGSLAKIGSRNLQEAKDSSRSRWYYWPEGSSSNGWSEEELRPLNKSEVGKSR